MFNLGDDGQVVAVGESVAGVLEGGQEFERLFQVVADFVGRTGNWSSAALWAALVGGPFGVVGLG